MIKLQKEKQFQKISLLWKQENPTNRVNSFVGETIRWEIVRQIFQRKLYCNLMFMKPVVYLDFRD